jgi:hypothetical protein
MAIREPVYFEAGTGSIRKFSSEQIDQIISECVYQYSLSPSVTLSVADSTGTPLAAMTDSRYIAGASSTDVAAFPTEATTAEPSIISPVFQRINQQVATVTPVTSTTTLWPAYFTSGENLQAMTLQDVKDTFLHPAIDLLTSASTSSTNQGGTYTISSSDSLADHTLVSATPVFQDTRADIFGFESVTYSGIVQNSTSGSGSGATFTIRRNVFTGVYDIVKTANGTSYAQTNTLTINGSQLGGTDGTHNIIITVLTTAAGGGVDTFTSSGAGVTGDLISIPEPVDQPLVINSYYLHRRNGAGSNSYTAPVFLKANGDVQVYSTANFSSYISDWIRYTAASSTEGYKITYNINGSGNNRGTSMVNTRFDDSTGGNYRTFQAAGSDDYRAQEIPNSTAIFVANTYNLNILKS